MGLVSTLVAGKSLHRLQSCDRRQAMGSRVQASGGEAAMAGGGDMGRNMHQVGLCMLCVNSATAGRPRGGRGWLDG